jgi:hypothetical protein
MDAPGKIQYSCQLVLKKNYTSLKHVLNLVQWNEVYTSEKSANYLTVGFKIL